MKIVLSLFMLIAFALAVSTVPSVAKDWTPLVGDKRVMKDGMVGCGSLDSYKALVKYAREGSDAGINVLMGNKLCWHMGGQKVQVVELDVISNGAIVVKPLDGELKGRRIWTLEKATRPV